MERDLGVHRHALGGRQRVDNYLRDIVIAIIVARIVERFGLAPTTSWEDYREHTACGVVSAALKEARINMAYKAVEGVWQDFKIAPGSDGSFFPSLFE